jgi:hypothetical protein
MQFKITRGNRPIRLAVLTKNSSMTTSLFTNIPGYLKIADNY